VQLLTARTQWTIPEPGRNTQAADSSGCQTSRGRHPGADLRPGVMKMHADGVGLDAQSGGDLGRAVPVHCEAEYLSLTAGQSGELAGHNTVFEFRERLCLRTGGWQVVGKVES